METRFLNVTASSSKILVCNDTRTLGALTTHGVVFDMKPAVVALSDTQRPVNENVEVISSALFLFHQLSMYRFVNTCTGSYMHISDHMYMCIHAWACKCLRFYISKPSHYIFIGTVTIRLIQRTKLSLTFWFNNSQ